MRRVVGTFLVFLLWLGPLAAIFPASAESRLPACCRRHGAHHCEMAAAQGYTRSNSGPVFGAPRHCPHYPSSLARSATRLDALTAFFARVPAEAVRVSVRSNSRVAVYSTLLRVRFDRGPPTSEIG